MQHLSQFLILFALPLLSSAFTSPITQSFFSKHQSSLSLSSQRQYFESPESSTSLIQEFALYSQLEELTDLASNPLPGRPDGIVTICKFSSLSRPECQETELEYERLSRLHPDTLFLRCFEEYEDAHLLISQAKVTALPTFDIFYKNKRVGRIEGNQYTEVEDYIKRYGFMNTKLDLFSEEAKNAQELKWGDGKKKDYSATPRTTNRFFPGYDYNTKKGFFDAQADKAMQDFEGMYENWTPPVDDDDKKK